MLAIMMAMLLASRPGALERLRPRALRPCSTTALDFTDPRVSLLRAALTGAGVFTVLAAALLVVLLRLELHPLLAAELLGLVVLLSARTAVTVVNAVLDRATPAQG